MRVLIIDDGFTGWAGHNAGYNLSLCAELSRRSIEHLLFCHETAKEVGGRSSHLRPVFRRFAATVSWRSPYLFRWINRVIGVLAANLGHLLDLLGRVGPDVRDGDLVLVTFQTYRTTLAYGFWALWLSLRQVRVSIVFVLHNLPHPYLGQEITLLRWLAWRQRILLAAHSEPVADCCGQAARMECHVLPLPFPGAGEAEPSIIPSSGGAVTFAYLGLASLGKGLDLVVEAIHLLSDLLDKGIIRLVIQCHVHRHNPDLEELRRRLEKLAVEKTGILVITRALSGEEYNREINAADVVLVPHRARSYREALSGIFADALARGKPVIVSEATHMAKLLDSHGAGLVFRDGDIAAFTGAIREMAARISEMKAKSIAAKSAWRNFHNPTRYVSDLLNMVA
jgi:glycosyltransferase involved in cell wall biosynthesis